MPINLFDYMGRAEDFTRRTIKNLTDVIAEAKNRGILHSDHTVSENPVASSPCVFISIPTKEGEMAFYLDKLFEVYKKGGKEEYLSAWNEKKKEILTGLQKNEKVFQAEVAEWTWEPVQKEQEEALEAE